MRDRVVHDRTALPPAHGMSRITQDRALGRIVAVGIYLYADFRFTVEQAFRLVDMSVLVMLVFCKLNGLAFVLEPWRGGLHGMLQEVIAVGGKPDGNGLPGTDQGADIPRLFPYHLLVEKERVFQNVFDQDLVTAEKRP